MSPKIAVALLPYIQAQRAAVAPDDQLLEPASGCERAARSETLATVRPYRAIMTDFDWQWNDTRTRRMELLRWAALQELNDFHQVPAELYAHLPESDRGAIAQDDVEWLDTHHWVGSGPRAMDGNVLGGVYVEPKSESRAEAESLQKRRTNRREREKACRSALLAWLDDVGGEARAGGTGLSGTTSLPAILDDFTGIHSVRTRWTSAPRRYIGKA